MSRSNSACATGISAVQCSRRSVKWLNKWYCPPALDSNGSASSANCRSDRPARGRGAAQPCAHLYVAVLNFGSMTDTILAASAMPMALIGGIFALVLTGIPISVSAAIGFVALFGISAMNGIIVIAYFNTLVDAGLDRGVALMNACAVKMRPVAMTCIVACVGLLPAALSTGIGSQVQKPLAVVVVGG